MQTVNFVERWGGGYLIRSWLDVIVEHWPRLVAGETFAVPEWLVPHPAIEGFQRIAGLPAGQVDDWALSYSDKSRVHVHVLADGSYRVHRDAHDPNSGVGEWILHALTETPLGPSLGLGALVAVASKS